MAQEGKAAFENEELRFVSRIEDVQALVDLIILSGSLEYVGNCLEYWKRMAALNARYVLFDRVPFTSWPEDKIVVQRIYRNTGGQEYESSVPV